MINLSDIRHLDTPKNLPVTESSRNPHVFEIHTDKMIFYAGEDLSCKEGSVVSSVESGIGLEPAKNFEAAIRQALMPVTPQASCESGQKGRIILL